MKFVLYQFINLRFSKYWIDTLIKRKLSKIIRVSPFAILGSFSCVKKKDKLLPQIFRPFYFRNFIISIQNVLQAPPVTITFACLALPHKEIHKKKLAVVFCQMVPYMKRIINVVSIVNF